MDRPPKHVVGAREPVDSAGRIVIVVDDGLATGSTMIATLNALRAAHERHAVASSGGGAH